MNDKFLVFRPPAKIGFQLESARRRGVHRWIAHFIPRLAKSLGPRHGSVCIAEHIFRRAIASAAKRNTHARRGVHRLSVDLEWRLDGLLDSFGHTNSFTSIQDVIQQDRKFIAFYS